MLNVDKYRKEIDQMIENGAKPRHMILNMCLEETKSESVDTAAALDWLFSEYEPPLLKNGDNLNPGDLIMVKDEFNDGWRKRVFVAYYDGRFLVVQGGRKIGEHNVVQYVKQARLPKDGE